MGNVSDVSDTAAQPHTPTPMRPLGRSLSDFSKLTPSERRLIDACRQGEICELGPGRPEMMSADTKIDANLVRFLALGGDESAPVHEKGVRLHGAWLDGVLDLGDCDLVRPIILSNCRIEVINADDARMPALHIESSRLERGLNGDRLDCKGVLSLVGDEVIAGEVVRLSRAAIGTLTCSGPFEGTLNTRIGGKPERLAIDLSGAVIHGDLALLTRTLGWVCLLGADVGGNLVCTDGRFENSGGQALLCDHIKVAGNVLLNNEFHATGAVRFIGAVIGGNLVCTGGRFENSDGGAFFCDHIKVAGNVFLNNEFHATGAVRFVDAVIGGNLICSGAQFETSGDEALACDKIEVAGNVFLNDKFHARGAVVFFLAKTGGSFFCYGGRFENPGGLALVCDRAEIVGDLSFGDRPGRSPNKAAGPGLHASGTVRLVGTRVGGNLDWATATIDNARDTALQCDLARIEGVFITSGFGSAVGQVVLSDMHVGVLWDDPQSWKRVRGELVLDGFRYDRIAGAPTNAYARIEWLKQQPRSHLTTEFRPQPWEQLISALRAMGHPREARVIAIEKQQHMFDAARMQLSEKPRWSGPSEACHWLAERIGWQLKKWLIGDLIGFGYAPQRLLLVMVGLWAVFGLGYLWASSTGQGRLQPACSVFIAAKEVGSGIVSANVPVAQSQTKPAAGGADPCGPTGRFDPFLYSADALLPIDLGYQSSFKPADTGWGGFFRWIAGLEVALGWLGIGLLIAALTNLIKKE
jgi:hypothetical protein